ncbi:sulfite exporter TauE/SafE family protein [Arenibacterium sp. CAU 1754]
MSSLFSLLPPAEWAMAFGIATVAGMVKGMVGFAMPMVLISGLGFFLSPEIALAGLILPTVVTNGFQALQQGVGAAMQSVRRFRVFMAVGLVFLLSSAQLVRILSPATLLLMLGIPVTFFALIQLFGVRLRLAEPSARIEAAIGAFAGFIGGMSGVWGPPTVLYLTALDTPKDEQIRVQGVIYGMGAIALLAAHTASGVMRAETLPFSVALVIPAVLGMLVGGRLRSRIDQVTFRKATLFVLLFAGLNLVRRGLLA